MKETRTSLANTDREELIVQYLLDGKTQREIADDFKARGIRPNSLSFIEKTIKVIRDRHKAKTMFHLGAILMLKRHIRKRS